MRPSGLQTAPVVPRAGEVARVSVTASCEAGLSWISQWWNCPFLRRSFVTVPPVAPSSARMCVREPKFDAERHLELEPPEMVYRMRDFGYSATEWAPIKMRQFIFTHTSGPVPRHAVLGVGGCPITRGRGSARGLVQCLLRPV